MATVDYQSEPYLEITYSGGNVACQDITSVSESKTDGKTWVKTINPSRRARGMMRGIPEFGLDLDVVIPVGDPEIDWEALWESGEIFNAAYSEGQGGRRFQLIDGFVADVNKTGKTEGGTTATVKLMFRDRIAE